MMLYTAPTSACDAAFLATLQQFLEEVCEGRFSKEDWHHALGGVHAWIAGPDSLISHAAVVERTLLYAGRRLNAGYVEAVATAAVHRRQGHAASVMAYINDVISERYEVGALSTGTPAFYATLGWELWRGATHVQGPHGVERTPDDDGSIMILRTPRTPALDLDADIACDWRAGSVW
jgi:aminoglycoside 2'-N-acetyltransferase I